MPALKNATLHTPACILEAHEHQIANSFESKLPAAFDMDLPRFTVLVCHMHYGNGACSVDTIV